MLKPQAYHHLLFNLNHTFQAFNKGDPISSSFWSSSPSCSKRDHPDLAHHHQSSCNDHRYRFKEINKSLKIFGPVSIKLSSLVYGFILTLESIFQALDDLKPDDRLLLVGHLGLVRAKFMGLIFHIFNVVMAATWISKFAKLKDERDSMRQTILYSIDAIIISLLPGIVLFGIIAIFQTSYGTRPLPPLFSPSENTYHSKIANLVEENLGLDVAPMFDSLVGIDMDQLGSPRLKRLLVRDLMGSLSSSVAITVPYGRSWTFGFVTLACSLIQKELATLLFRALARRLFSACCFSSQVMSW